MRALFSISLAESITIASLPAIATPSILYFLATSCSTIATDFYLYKTNTGRFVSVVACVEETPLFIAGFHFKIKGLYSLK